MNAWKQLELGEQISLQVDYLSSSENALVTIGNLKINLGRLTDDVVGEKIVVEKASEQFGVCLNTEYREDGYLDSHPLASYNFYQNVGTHSDPEYRAWIRSNSDPQPGEVFTAKIDRIGWNDMGVVDVNNDYKILVNGVTQGDVGKLVEARMRDNGRSTNKAEKRSGDLRVIDTLPSAHSVESVERIENHEDSSEDALTNASEEGSSSGEETVSPQNDSGSQTLSSLRKKAEEDAIETVPEESSTSKDQPSEYTRSEKVKKYAKARAEGVCEGCSEPAPFTSKAGTPYLHAHHVHELSEGGSDTPETVIALCPNCHYRVHHGEDGKEYNEKLIQRLADIEGLSAKSVQSQTR
ncbi:HNH endonuclease (plasmid) [Haloarcula salina]|uniref:HNH endonuclease n=1 Tax=Haloarcula salina TaxID=1429914 RepID=UPI003C7049F9